MIGSRNRAVSFILSILMVTACLAALPIQGHAAAIMKPYLQAVMPDSVYIMAESTAKSPITVEYGLDTTYGMEASTETIEPTDAKPVTYIHNIRLSGLEPETVYHYRLKKDGIDKGDHTFKTPALPGTSFRFAFAADFRTGNAIHDEISSRVKAAKPDFLVYGGDLCADFTYTSFKRDFFRPAELSLLSNTPLFNAPGNHELWSTNAKAFMQSPASPSGTQDYYSFDYGDAHFLVINNTMPYNAGSPQYLFAQKDLSSTKKSWKIVISHYPAYCAGGHGEEPGMKALVKNVFEPNKVDMVISGHSHFFQHNLVNGIHHMILGTAGAPFYDPGKASYVKKSAKDYNYGIVDVTPLTYHMVVYNNKGKVLDTIDLKKKSGAAASPAKNIHLSWDQNKADSTISVTWTSHNKEANVIKYGTTSAYDREAAGVSAYRADLGQYVITAELAELTPDTVYHYTCGSPVLGWSPDGTFATAPQKGAAKAFRIGIFSDTQDDGNNSKFVLTRNIAGRLAAYKPNFSLFMGDMVVNGTYKQSWLDFFNATEKLSAKAPFMPVAGNHDSLDDQSLPSYYYELLDLPENEKWYSFDYGNVHFTALYTGRPLGLSDDKLLLAPGTEQYKWLESDLEKAANDPDATWKVVYMHYPPYAESGSQAENVRKYMAPLMDKYGVDLVICGHRHVYERMKALYNNEAVQEGPDYTASPSGTVYVIPGPAGNPLQGPGKTDKTAFSETGYAFGILEVDGKSLSYKAIHDTGVVFDRWTIKK